MHFCLTSRCTRLQSLQLPTASKKQRGLCKKRGVQDPSQEVGETCPGVEIHGEQREQEWKERWCWQTHAHKVQCSIQDVPQSARERELPAIAWPSGQPRGHHLCKARWGALDVTSQPKPGPGWSLPFWKVILFRSPTPLQKGRGGLGLTGVGSRFSENQSRFCRAERRHFYLVWNVGYWGKGSRYSSTFKTTLQMVSRLQRKTQDTQYYRRNESLKQQ